MSFGRSGAYAICKPPDEACMFDGTVDGLRQAVVAKMAKMQLRYR
jgi:hypothetical protein